MFMLQYALLSDDQDDVDRRNQPAVVGATSQLSLGQTFGATSQLSLSQTFGATSQLSLALVTGGEGRLGRELEVAVGELIVAVVGGNSNS